MKLTFGACLLLLATASAQSQTFRCTTPEGRIIYTDIPCHGTATGGAVNVRENVINQSERRADWERRHPQMDSESPQTASSGASYSAGATNGFECEKARRHLKLEQNISMDRSAAKIHAAKVQVDLTCNRPVQSRPPNGHWACENAMRNYRAQASRGDLSGQSAVEAACGKVSTVRMPTPNRRRFTQPSKPIVNDVGQSSSGRPIIVTDDYGNPASGFVDENGFGTFTDSRGNTATGFIDPNGSGTLTTPTGESVHVHP